ncbi:MAG: hypothetical protein R6U11_10475 [Bacteroidales bacterium]
MRKAIVYIFLLLFSSSVYSLDTDLFFKYPRLEKQNKSHESSFGKKSKEIKIFKYVFYPETAINYYFDNFMSLEFGIYKINTSKYSSSFPSLFGSSSSITIEGHSNFKDAFIIGPKYTFMAFLGIFEVGASAAVYTDFEDFTVCVRPFAGLTVFGISSLSFGYNYNIPGYGFKQLSNYSLQLKIRFGLF